MTQLKKPRKDEKRIGEESLKNIIESEDFYTTEKTSTGTDFFYFHNYGDYLKGQLLGKVKSTNITRPASYRIHVEAMRRDGAEVRVVAGQVEEFPGNRHLQRVIDKNELIGSTVRIVYIGRQKSRFGHSAKIYDVFKITSGGYTFPEKKSYQDGTKRKYKSRQKARTSPKSGAARLRKASGRTR